MSVMTTQNLRKLGEEIRSRRGELGLTQKEAAFRSDLTETAYGEIERGLRNPRAITSLRLDRCMDWPPNTTRLLATGAIDRPATGPDGPVAAPRMLSGKKDVDVEHRISDLESALQRQETTLAELRSLLYQIIAKRP